MITPFSIPQRFSQRGPASLPRDAVKEVEEFSQSDQDSSRGDHYRPGNDYVTGGLNGDGRPEITEVASMV